MPPFDMEIVKRLKHQYGLVDAREMRDCWGRECISRDLAWHFLALRLQFMNLRGQDILQPQDLKESLYQCT